METDQQLRQAILHSNRLLAWGYQLKERLQIGAAERHVVALDQ
jgi:hypothetical protein